MARFPYRPADVQALGRLLGEAAIDAAKRQALIDDPKGCLRRAGLSDDTIALIDFKVVADSVGKTHVVLPYRLNARRVEAGDADYLSGLARSLVPQALN